MRRWSTAIRRRVERERSSGNVRGAGRVATSEPSGEEEEELEMQTEIRRRFRSIEAVDPTTLTVDPDRVMVTHGDADAPAVVIPLSELTRVKVRVLLGIATLLLKTAQGRTTVVDLLLPADARA